MLTSGRPRFRGPWGWLAILALAVAACQDLPVSPPEGPGSGFAKPGATPVVTATDPPYGYQGDVNLPVRVLGSGFALGAQAIWERGGGPDPKITVHSTRFISSTELEATITIAADATVALYDVAVVSNGKKGIGTERFEVTQAIAIEGAALARAVNENGQVVGIGPYFWSQSTGLESLSASSGAAWDLSEDGQTVVGALGGGSATSGTAVAWTRSGSAWVSTVLPRNSGAGAGNARAVASDPTTGAATVIGGVETFLLKGNRYRREPRLWVRSGGAWVRTVLPGAGGGTEGQVNDLNSNGMVVGNSAGSAAVWTPNGSGGWSVASIGPAGSDALAINGAGDLIVGQNGPSAVYWIRSGAGWSATLLPGGCQWAADVDDAGGIIANHCPQGNRATAVVIQAPYSVADIQYLPGFGNRTDGGQAEAISPSGQWIAGRAILGNGGTIVGSYWKLF